ncbi:MAG: ferritin family protein [Candidatus Brocadiaceae bacterium]|jgi:rubrerythrin
MPELFSARELIEIAVREEKTGATFYRELAESTDSAELREFALEVAQMEDEHEEKFRRLLDRLGDYAPTGEQYPGEYESYMSYLVEGRIFPMGEDGEQMARRQESDREAVDTAMSMERNTLLFYHEMLQFVPEQDRPLLEEIIAEERQHVTDFARYKAEHF